MVRSLGVAETDGTMTLCRLAKHVRMQFIIDSANSRNHVRLVREGLNGGGHILHRLLADHDEASARPIKVLDQQ